VSPSSLIHTFGTLGVIGIIFAETGLLIGFFLPGDSLLVTAGVLSSPGRHLVGHVNLHLNLWLILAGASVAAALGGQLGYLIGQRAGPALFNRPSSRLFKPAYVTRAHDYFNRYGNRTIVVARFVPVVRTFANPVAGMSEMDTRTFTIYNVGSAVVWAVGVTLLGYFIGNSVKDTYLIPTVIVVSMIPVVVEVLRERARLRRGAA
jgi:membrane-associated protein